MPDNYTHAERQEYNHDYYQIKKDCTEYCRKRREYMRAYRLRQKLKKSLMSVVEKMTK